MPMPDRDTPYMMTVAIAIIADWNGEWRNDASNLCLAFVVAVAVVWYAYIAGYTGGKQGGETDAVWRADPDAV